MTVFQKVVHEHTPRRDVAHVRILVWPCVHSTARTCVQSATNPSVQSAADAGVETSADACVQSAADTCVSPAAGVGTTPHAGVHPASDAGVPAAANTRVLIARPSVACHDATSLIMVSASILKSVNRTRSTLNLAPA